MIRNLLVVCLTAAVAACASTDGPKVAAKPPVTPTQQYSIQVKKAPDEILLGPHASGLSANQAVALGDLVARWKDAGAQTLVIKTPTAGGPTAYRMVEAIRGQLEDLGVAPEVIQLVGYETQPGPVAPIVVGFERYKAEIPQCGRSWGSLTHTINNEVDPNFGCANTANLAALVANPEDLVHPATMGDTDAARKEVVLDKYRKGELTSSPKEPQADATISTAIP